MWFGVNTGFPQIAPKEFVLINAMDYADAMNIFAKHIPVAANYFWVFKTNNDPQRLIDQFVAESKQSNKYVLDHLLVLPTTHINKVHAIKMPDGTEGMVCISCKKYYPHSVGNQVDGTLKCYECREGLVRKK